jgi:hypothetical protein
METTFESKMYAPAPPTHAPAMERPHAVEPVFMVILKAARIEP